MEQPSGEFARVFLCDDELPLVQLDFAMVLAPRPVLRGTGTASASNNF
jgi:hypothetical protein